MTGITIAHLAERIAAHEPRTAAMSGRIQAAVAIVLAPGPNDAPEVLFIRRADAHGDPWSGQMGLPGGRREAGDPDLLTTAQRETHEETGIALSPSALLGALDDLAPVTPVLPPVVVRPFVFALPARPTVSPSPEVADHVWVPLATLLLSAGEADIAMRGVNRRMPAYLVGPYIVWGMTHRIIINLFEIAS